MLPPGLIDLVFLCDTYHHIDDRLEYLRALRHNLTDGGRLAVIDFYKKKIPVGPPEAHKLSREQEKKFLPYQYFLIFRTR